MRLWKEQVLLARRPNVWRILPRCPTRLAAKNSPGPALAAGFAAPSMGWCQKAAVGTDMPRLRHRRHSSGLLHQMDVHLAKLEPAERQAVLGLNALRKPTRF